MQVTVCYTGLLQLHMRKHEEAFVLGEGASLADLVAVLRGQEADFAGYFAVVQPPDQRAFSVPLEQADETLLIPDSRITFVYRFAGG